MKIITNLIILLALNYNPIFSQITTSDIEAKKNKVAINENIEVYDSLKSWEYFDKPIQYKKYIGQKIYLPTNPNDSIDKIKKGNNNKPILFVTKNKAFKLNSNNVVANSMLKSTFAPGNIIDSYHRLIELDSIVTNIYKPLISNSIIDPYSQVYRFNVTNSNKIRNKYYRVINVGYLQLYSGYVKFSTAPILSEQENKKREKKIEKGKDVIDYRKFMETPLTAHKRNRAFLLVEELSGDTVACFQTEIPNFILVSHFVKQKELYENNYFLTDRVTTPSKEQKDNFIDYKLKDEYRYWYSRWLCKSVTVSKKTGKLIYVLENDKGDIRTPKDMGNYILEDKLINQIQKETLEEEKLTALRLKKEQDLVTKKSEDKINKKRLYIEKYGKEKGTLIADGKIELGMSKEMCKDALGAPNKTSQTIRENVTFDIWRYKKFLGFGMTETRALYFKNNKLDQITNK